MSNARKREERIQAIREEDDEGELDGVELAEAKVLELFKGNHYQAVHMSFLHFCTLILSTEPARVCGYNLLPTVAIMRRFAYYLAVTRKGRNTERLKLITLLTYITAEMRVLKLLSGLEWQLSEINQIFRFISGKLRDIFSLQTEDSEQPTVTAKDFQVIVHHATSLPFYSTLYNMRESLYILLFINLYIDTGSRGNDLLFSNKKGGLKWRDCTFFLTTSETDPSRVLLAVEVKYLMTKLRNRHRTYKSSKLIELPEVSLAFDTTALLFITAMIAGVFPADVEWDSLHQRYSGAEIGEQVSINAVKLDDYVFENVSEFTSEPHGAYDLIRIRNILRNIGNALGFVDSLHHMLYAVWLATQLRWIPMSPICKGGS